MTIPAFMGAILFAFMVIIIAIATVAYWLVPALIVGATYCIVEFLKYIFGGV